MAEWREDMVSYLVFWCWWEERQAAWDRAEYLCSQHWGNHVLLHSHREHLVSILLWGWQGMSQRVLRIYGGSLARELKLPIGEGVWRGWGCLKWLMDSFVVSIWTVILPSCSDWSCRQSVVECDWRGRIGDCWRGTGAPRTGGWREILEWGRAERGGRWRVGGRQAESWTAAAVLDSVEEENKEAGSLRQIQMILMLLGILRSMKDLLLSGPKRTHNYFPYFQI